MLDAGFPRRSLGLGNVGIVCFSVIALAWLAGRGPGRSGTTERNQPSPHWSSVGESAFRLSWSIEASFRQLLGIEVKHIPCRSEGNEAEGCRSIPRCQAWPAPEAIVPHQGEWQVCLEANPASPAAAPGR